MDDRFEPCDSDDPIEHFWTEVARGWDIEPRAYFEKEAVPMGFRSPVEMAVHWMWKRRVHEDHQEAAALSSPSAQELRDALAFIERQGYRRCDIAACNCGSWHGGHASQRLSEIEDALVDSGIEMNGKTILAGVQEALALSSPSVAPCEAVKAFGALCITLCGVFGEVKSWPKEVHEAAEIVGNALSAQSPSVAESPTWQPMETMPEDRQVLVCWSNDTFDTIGRDEYLEIMGYGETPAKGWMPLPSAPSAAAQKETP